MKQMSEILLSREPVAEIVMGNTALVRAMVEAGTRVVTSYPGSPTPEIASAIETISKAKRPFYFEFSINEKVATEVAFGAAVNGHLSTVFFKSVGLNVAADSFVQLGLLNIIGGMVIVLGDDPGANSSQNEQDNRHYAQMAYIPLFEPASPSEVYEYYREAARIATAKQMPVILRLTTHVCHAKEKVSFLGWQPEPYDYTPRFSVENGPYIPIAAAVFPLKRKALQKLHDVEEFANHTSLNQIIDHQNKKRGIITAGLPCLSLLDVLEQANKKPDILKLAVVYPVAKELVVQFLEEHEEVLILEELDPVLEREIKAIAFDNRLTVKIYGKKEHEDLLGEYTPDKVHEVLQKNWPDLLPAVVSEKTGPPVPPRPAQMCPGCGHRSAFHAVKKALADKDISVADIGCHSLGFLPPYKMGELLLCMGASSGIGAGLALGNDSRKVVVFMGDSTFFHAGIPGIINAVYNCHNLTMIVMENGTTAMTGHQDNPTSGRNFNDPAEKITIRNVLEGLGVQHIYDVGAYQQAKLVQLVEKANLESGFSVVIARHPCMLKFNREQRRKENYKARHVTIDQSACQQIHTCISTFACPAFARDEDGVISTNPDLCIGDGSCRQTCPVSAITTPKTE